MSKKEKVLYTIILITFIVLSTIVSLKHEYWADEANTWLIVREVSIIDLFKEHMSLNGHPFVFIFIIKIFQLLGFKYNYYRIISLLFSSLGVAFFLFKSTYKWYVKILIPFTFFIFYQYTVITRGYCLLLLLFSLLASIWEDKDNHYILFTFLLFILTNLEAYTFLIAGSIYLLELIKYFKDIKINKQNKKKTICLIILFLSFVFTTIYMFPRPKNVTQYGAIHLVLSDAFIYSETMPYILSGVFTLLIIGFIIYLYLKQKKKKELIELGILLTPMYLFFSFFYGNYWHAGIIFVLFLFSSWIHEINKNKAFNIFIVLVCFVQIFWSIKSSINDYKYIYSPSKQVADYIKKYNYQELKIYADKYITVAINPYFEKNIFDNCIIRN